MVDYARQRKESDANAWVVQHIQAPHEAELLADRCSEIFERQSVFTSEIGPVLGVHTGPGLLGVGSIPARFFQGGSRRRNSPKTAGTPPPVPDPATAAP